MWYGDGNGDGRGRFGRNACRTSASRNGLTRTVASCVVLCRWVPLCAVPCILDNDVSTPGRCNLYVGRSCRSSWSNGPGNCVPFFPTRRSPAPESRARRSAQLVTDGLFVCTGRCAPRDDSGVLTLYCPQSPPCRSPRRRSSSSTTSRGVRTSTSCSSWMRSRSRSSARSGSPETSMARASRARATR